MAKSEYARLCATKKSRQALVDAMRELAQELGASCEWTDYDRIRGREVFVTLTGAGFSVSEWLGGDSHVNSFMDHWKAKRRREVSHLVRLRHSRQRE
jgi:hypothetical protein